MARYLVVVEGTLGGTALHDELRDRAGRGRCEVHVLVPATEDAEAPPASDGVVAGATTSNLPAADPGRTAPAGGAGARDVAFGRMKHAMASLEEVGVDAVEGEVGDPDPEQAIADALAAAGPFDEILVATPPAGASRWVRMDLASKVARRHDVPVTGVEAPPAPSTE